MEFPDYLQSALDEISEKVIENYKVISFAEDHFQKQFQIQIINYTKLYNLNNDASDEDQYQGII